MVRLQDSIHFPKYIRTNEKCSIVEKGHRCENKAEIEMIVDGDKISTIVKFCDTHAKLYDEQSYNELKYRDES